MMIVLFTMKISYLCRAAAGYKHERDDEMQMSCAVQITHLRFLLKERFAAVHAYACV